MARYRSLIAVFVAGGLGACTGGGSPPTPTPPPPLPTPVPPSRSTPLLPQVAGIVCPKYGIEVRTPVVEAQPDGVYFSVVNVSEDVVTFYPGDPNAADPHRIELASHGDNQVPAHSVKTMRWVVPPGLTWARCIGSGGEVSTVVVIADFQRLYRPILPPFGCRDAGVTTYEFFARTHFGSSEEANETVRRELRGLRSHDVLQRVGYPEQPHVWVSVLRGGVEVALVNFGPVGTSTVATCRDSGIRPR